MKRVTIVPALVTAFFALSPVGVALADRNPAGTGQPGQSANVSQPGVTSPAGFGTQGFANAENVYANPGSTGGTSSGNAHVVSQYDVAGYQWCQHHTSC
jgi:hypothetical protein